MWHKLAEFILKFKVYCLAVLLVITIVMGYFAAQVKLSYEFTKAIPDDNPKFVIYKDFVKKFGIDGATIVVGFTTDKMYTKEVFNQVHELHQQIKLIPAVTEVLSVPFAYELQKDSTETKFNVHAVFSAPYQNDSLLLADAQKFETLPFYKNLLYNKDSNAFIMAVSFIPDSINTGARTRIIRLLEEKLNVFSKNTNLAIHLSGLPYIRTIIADRIKKEMLWFLVGSLLLSAITLLLFFRSIPATLMSLAVVAMGVIWSFGTMVLMGQKITLLTALIPPLVVVIGIPNCIFLINKYQHEVNKHGNKAKSLQRVISKVGNATLMTNVTTASGFATFIITQSKLLTEFGIVASLSIIAIFLLCLLIIPIIYSFMPIPKEKHLEHLNKRWINHLGDWIEHTVKHKNITIYITAILLLVISIIGIFQIETTGSLIEDMPKKAEFYKDIEFYESEFNGVMPLEVLVDTKRKKGVIKLSTLKRMNALEDLIVEIPELSKPVSVVSLVKYSKQAYYNGNPKYYQLPSAQENSFILSYAKNASTDVDLLKNFVDSTGRYARITTFMKDAGIDKMERIEEDLLAKINKLFPKKQYEVSITGKAYLFQKGTKYLVRNLVLSLALAIFLISLLVAGVKL